MNEMDKKILKNADIIVLRDKGLQKYLSINALRNMLGLLRSCLGRDFKYSYAPTECSVLAGDLTVHEYFNESQNMKGMKDSRDPLIFPSRVRKLLNSLGDLNETLSNTNQNKRQLIAIIEALLNPVEYLLIESPCSYLSKKQIEQLKEYLLVNKQSYQSILLLSHHSEYWHSIADYFVDFDKEKGLYNIYDNHLKKGLKKDEQKLKIVHNSSEKKVA